MPDPKSTYEGDFVDQTATPLQEKYSKLDLQDPAELLCLFDDRLRAGKENGGFDLYSWQTELLEHFARVKPTGLTPHKFCLVAANGSGKDSIIAAAFSVWFTLCKIESRVIITSSSGTQLTSQTEPAIRGLCQKINDYFGAEYFRIRQRYIKCRLSGSEIRMFATDEEGKAEGYHPISPGREMAILINESKSVKQEIHDALRRCTGYNYWIEYSSPGAPTGAFYKLFEQSQFTELENLQRINSRGKYACRVTSYDCPAHLSVEDREDDKRELGEHSALFRSKHLALFTSVDQEVIISNELMKKVLDNPPKYNLPRWPVRVGIDIAAGGDENVICFSQGNKIIKEVWFRETDTTITATRIAHELLVMKIPQDHKFIYADDGGIGHAVIDMLVKKKWKINRIMNQWAAINKRQFGNRGAENWYRIKRLCEELLLDLGSTSAKTREQLVNRYYKQGAANSGRIFLQSKKEAKANGYPSPDRADALILSFTGLSVEDFLKATDKEDKKPKDAEVEHEFKNQQDLIDFYRREVTYGEYNKVPQKKKISCYSLRELFERN